MKASELRILNYVKSVLYKDILQINVIDLCGVVGIQGGGILDMKHIEPIPLTEEWLVKFKEWKKEDNLYVIRLDTINYSLRPDYINNDGELCWEFYVHNIRGEKVGCAYIKYIHQLQNLYFALTGEELTIKTEQQCQQ